jgi:hypothetical protein
MQGLTSPLTFAAERSTRVGGVIQHFEIIYLS